MFIDTYKTAISLKKELLLKVKSGTETTDFIELTIQPYIFGIDVLQYEFLWGYLPGAKIFYKLFADQIISAEITNTPYDILPDSMYEPCSGEEHYSVIEGININFGDADAVEQ